MAVCATILAVAGCAINPCGHAVVENPVVEHYRQMAERVAMQPPNVDDGMPSPTIGTGKPLVAPRRTDLRPISLAEAIRSALQNNKIIRQNAQFMSPQNPVLANPDAVASVFDPVIQNSSVLFGTRGTEAALSDFDPRISSSIKSGRDETGQNSSIQQGAVLLNNYSQSEIRMDQQLMSGGILSLRQTWNYSSNNGPNQIFDQSYSGQLGAEFRQPMWAGAGPTYTSIAGPVSQQARGFSYVNQGIVIARINNHIAEIDVEENILNLLREVGDLYWDLYQAHHAAEAERDTVAAARQMWEDVKAKFESDLVGAAETAQAEEAYHEAVVREEQALTTLFQTEGRLRRMLGMPIDDGKILYPSNEPALVDTTQDRTKHLFDALTNRIELRRQKTNLHSLQLQLYAAKNLANPRLDFVTGYSLNGFGQNLISGGAADGITQEGFNNAYTSLFRGKETSWSLGLEYTVPLWLRSQRSQVNQLEFRIVKAKFALATQEDEISRELYSTLQNIEQWKANAKSNNRRYLAALRRVDASKTEYRDAGRISIDQVLRAQTSLTLARIAYYRSLAEYSKALRDLMYRTGRLISGDDIELLDHQGQPVIPKSTPVEDLLPVPPKTPNPDEPTDKPSIARTVSHEVEEELEEQPIRIRGDHSVPAEVEIPALQNVEEERFELPIMLDSDPNLENPRSG